MIAQGKEKKKDWKEGYNMEQGVFAYFVVKTSKLVESYRAAKIRIIVTIFLTIGIKSNVLAVLFT